MMFVRFTTFLVALLALTPVDIERAGASTVAADEHQRDNPPKRAGSAHNSRSLEESECSFPPMTASEVSATADEVARFYQRVQRSADPASFLKTIEIDVNFVIFHNMADEGVSQGQAVAQIDLLNNAFSPDFSFTLKTAPVVKNDGYYNVNINDATLIKEFQTATRRGGKETLNVWVMNLQGAASSSSNPINPFAVNDGIVIKQRAITGSGDSYYSQGIVGNVWTSLDYHLYLVFTY
jgi:hypothetical protein